MNRQCILRADKDRSGIHHGSVGKVLFEALQKFGDRVAIVDFESKRKLKFNDILTRSSKLALSLKRLGFKRNDTIVLISYFSFDFCIIYLACLFNGHTIFLLNPDSTTFELRQYLDQTSPKIVFSCEKSLENILSLKREYSNLKHVLVLDPKISTSILSIDDLIKNEAVQDFEPDSFDPDDTNAVIIFSSGSTGLPKAVALNHTNMRMCLLQSQTYYSGVTDKDVLLHVTPVFHIAGSLLFFNGILNGAKIIRLLKFVPETYLSALEKYEVTKILLVPQLVNFFVHSPMLEKYNLSKIRYIVVSSAPTSSELLEKLHNKFPQAEINHMYGMTETSACITQNRSNQKLGSVGVLFPYNEAKIVDLQTGEALGPNQPGEICFRGDSVFKKYYNNSEISKEVFDKDGFLRSGDVAYYDEDNYIYIVDRIKDFMKYKGFQVSPTEIENILSLHPAVEDVGVFGVPDERVGELPCAFIVKKLDNKTTEEDICNFVAEKLSSHKNLHGEVMFVKEIPRNPMRKKDRKAMQALWEANKSM